MDIETIKSKLNEIAENKQIKDWDRREHMLRCLSDNGVEVVSTGGRNLGRCYNAMNYEIRSKEPVPVELVRFFWDKGLLGYGQEFHIEKSVSRGELHVIATEARVDSSD